MGCGVSRPSTCFPGLPLNKYKDYFCPKTQIKSKLCGMYIVEKQGVGVDLTMRENHGGAERDRLIQPGFRIRAGIVFYSHRSSEPC